MEQIYNEYLGPVNRIHSFARREVEAPAGIWERRPESKVFRSPLSQSLPFPKPYASSLASGTHRLTQGECDG